MKQFLLIFSFILSFSFLSNGQSKIEEDIEVALQNAKKGIYWALDNIPEKKTKIENDLIADDKLYSSIKLEKGINGVKVESIGYNQTNAVTIKIYKSYDNLIKEGYLKRAPSE